MDLLPSGAQAEREACHFLQQNGLTLIERNYACSMGEIDLIMQDGETWVFVEVKQRAPTDYAHPLESITPAKQRKIIKTATLYLLERNLYEKVFCRFDAVAIYEGKIEWVKNAFSAD